MHELVRALSAEQVREPSDAVPVDDIRPGATVRVHFRIVEGRRERVQPFQGVVLRSRQGVSDANFTVRRTGAHGVGVERTFPLHSPRLEAVEVLRQGHVRRASLYYLRERTGKSARLREERHRRAPVAHDVEGADKALGEVDASVGAEPPDRVDAANSDEPEGAPDS